MSTPETTAPQPPAAPAPAAAPLHTTANPDLQAIDLLGQAFNQAGQAGQVILSGQIGAALQRMLVMASDKAALQTDIERLKHELVQAADAISDLTAQVQALTPPATPDPVETPFDTPDPVETPFVPPAPDAIAVPAAEAPPSA